MGGLRSRCGPRRWTRLRPVLTAVKGQNESASYYSTLLGRSALPTPLWNRGLIPTEQAISIRIDNTSVFVPGGGPPQYGFRRTEFIAQKNGSAAALDAEMEVGVSVFHFSIKEDEGRPLNYSHEYQIVFIEPSDGSHVFGIQLGSPFTDPTGPLPAANAHSFKVLDHALNVLFTAPFVPRVWHNFAVTVDWGNRTLAAVTATLPNPTATQGAVGDFHFGVLKLPLVNPADSAADQSDVVHHGIQEGTTEGLFYSGVFVERQG
ncbi:hypothetical protein B0H17DRAFT_1144463 [Mycena rosella]|uniref:Glycoside hydrolase 131 catalytic N-terminal domain-containing protein n=1 Tax=Mycena rosella TaxID=1033263 RepID=A0AAD7CWQ5_MYCRO|nr:hypothetical protein B0H17DRAFT_1144463 [Mycena rosella]